MSAKQTMTWNGEADAKLLLAILKASDVKLDFDAVSKQLTTDTTICTPRAVQEHLKKLRKMAQTDSDPTPTGKSTTAKATTPTSIPTGKGSRKTVATPAAGVKKGRKPAAAATGGKGRKGKSAAHAENASVKVEIGSDDPPAASKKRKYHDVMDASSDIGEDSADDAQGEPDDDFIA